MKHLFQKYGSSILLFGALCICSCSSKSTINSSTGDLSKPPSPPVETFSGGQALWFEVTKIDLAGDSWSTTGYDLDNSDTTESDLLANCKKPANALERWSIDGEKGIDNNFAKFISKNVLGPVGSQRMLDKVISSDIKQWTLLIRLDNVGPDNNANVPGALYVGWNLTEDKERWMIARSSLENDATATDIATKAKRKFLNGYMRDGIWVSGPNSNFDLTIMGNDASLAVSILKGVITINTKTNTGILAGALDVQELIEALKPNVPKIDRGLCAVENTIYDSLSKAADAVSTAPQLRDASQTCNAISFGFGLRVNPIPKYKVPDKINDRTPRSSNICPR